MINDYFSKIKNLLNTIETDEKDKLKLASEKVSEAIQNDGVIHLFGCVHSHILMEEVYYRAGGLVPIQPNLHEPLMLHEGAVQTSINEKKNDDAECFMQEQDIKEQDIIFVISTSGRNPIPVDVAT